MLNLGLRCVLILVVKVWFWVGCECVCVRLLLDGMFVDWLFSGSGVCFDWLVDQV